MATTRLAENVFLFLSDQTKVILASGDTNFVRFCLTVETLVASQGAIVHQYLVAVPASHEPPSDEDASPFSDDDMSSGTGGFLEAVGNLFGGGDSGIKTRGDPESAQVVPLQEMQSRGVHERGLDNVVLEGDDAVNADAAHGASGTTVRRRGDGAIASGGDVSTYSVDDTEGGSAAAAAATVTPPPHALFPDSVLHGSVVVPVESVATEEPLLQWFTIERIDLWHAYIAHDAVCRIDGHLISDIASGHVNASPGDDLRQRLSAWSMRTIDKVIVHEAATRLLLDTMEVNKERLSDTTVQGQILSLLQATLDARRCLLPRAENARPADSAGTGL